MTDIALHARPAGCDCADPMVFGHGCPAGVPAGQVRPGYAQVPVIERVHFVPLAENCARCGFQFKRPQRRQTCQVRAACDRRADRLTRELGRHQRPSS